MTTRLTYAALAALLVLGSACGKEPSAAPTPSRIETTTAPTSTVTAGSAAGTFAVRVTNDDGTPAAGAGVTFTVVGNGSVSPTSTSTDAAGIARTAVTAGNTAGQVTITATVTGKPLTAVATLVVTASGPVTCTSPAVGAETTYQGLAAACVTGGAAGADYVLVAYNTSATGAASTTLTGTGIAVPPSTTVLSPSAATAYRGESPASSTLRPDAAFHRRLQERSAELAPLMPGARRWMNARRSASRSTSLTAEGSVATHAAIPAIPANPQVGQLVPINVNASTPCLSADIRPTRIMAVGARSVVLADTANPANGFTMADYERFAARFDTLVYPLDVTNFGAPSDIDGNGRVGIVFTRAVNELTAKSSSSFVGGFFFSRDLFPKDTTARLAGCAGSNEGELFYMLAPDPTGVAYTGSDGTASSSNVRRTGFVDSITTATIAHEFQHLINASRRLYVNQGATRFEIVWLNEGLSHIAEELLYYRESGKQPRANLDDNAIRVSSPQTFPFWRQDAASNFSRFASYLREPEKHSPVAENDQLAVRGATWSFLRYAADQKFSADGDVWFRLANSTQQGFATLSLVFGNEAPNLLRDWTVANYIDDTGFSSDVRYMHKSWNYRDIFTKTFVAGVYPLKVTGLSNSAPQSVLVVQNSAAYYRFTVPPNGEGRLELGGTTSEASPFQFIVLRTR